MEPWYLVGVFADNCGACTRFKQERLNDVINVMKTYTRVKFIPIYLRSMGERLPQSIGTDTIPDGLNKYIRYYPIFFLLSPQAWKSNDMSKLNIFSAMITNGEVKPLPGNPNKDSLLEWVKNNIEQPQPQMGVNQVQTSVAPKMIPTEGSCSFKIIPRR